MNLLRDFLIALAVGGTLWYLLKLQPAIGVLLVATLFLSTRYIAGGEKYQAEETSLTNHLSF